MTESDRFRRVLVLGGEGAGKTTVARWLAELLDAPLHDIDEQGGGGLATIVAEPAWVIAGNHIETLDERVRRADLVVLLDLSPALIAARVLWRRLRHDAGQALDRIPEPPPLELLRLGLQSRAEGVLAAARDGARWRRIASGLAALPGAEGHPFRMRRLRAAARALRDAPAAQRDVAREAYRWRERELPPMIELLRRHGVERAVVLYTWAELDRMQRHQRESDDVDDACAALAMWLRPLPEPGPLPEHGPPPPHEPPRPA